MVIGKDKSQQSLPKNIAADVTVLGNHVKQVAEVTYLGAKITSDGRNLTEMSVRIDKSAGAFNQIKKKQKNVGDPVKIRI